MYNGYMTVLNALDFQINAFTKPKDNTIMNPNATEH